MNDKRKFKTFYRPFNPESEHRENINNLANLMSQSISAFFIDQGDQMEPTVSADATLAILYGIVMSFAEADQTENALRVLQGVEEMVRDSKARVFEKETANKLLKINPK